MKKFPITVLAIISLLSLGLISGCNQNQPTAEVDDQGTPEENVVQDKEENTEDTKDIDNDENLADVQPDPIGIKNEVDLPSDPARAKESGEKGGTADINIGVGE